MRRSVLLFLLYSVLASLVLSLSGCGGGDDPNEQDAKISTVTVGPASISLNKGDVFQPTAAAKNAAGTTIVTDFTFSLDPSCASSAASCMVSTSPAGLLCAGKWDANFIVCSPSTASGTATLTATAGGINGTAKIFVHEKVDFVQAFAGGTGCISSKDTQQFSAKAFSRDLAVCTALGATVPCELPAASLGPFTWVSNDSAIVSVDNTAEKSGLATATLPGRTSVFASLSTVNSPSFAFDTCPVKSIQVTLKDSTNTSFTSDKAATTNLVAVVKDSKDKTLDAPPLVWNSTESFAVSVTGQSNLANAIATAANPGASLIEASCSPPNCNRNLTPVYGNPILGKVNGTAAGTVYVAGKESTQLVPIEVGTNTAGTAVTLPRLPNSIAVTRQGTRLALGSTAGGTMLVETTANTVSSLSTTATVLGFTPDSLVLVLMDTGAKIVYFYEISSAKFNGGYVIDPILTNFDATVDGTNVWAVNGTNKLYRLGSTSATIVNLAAPADDLAFLASGPLAYLAGGAGAGISVRATCTTEELETQVASGPKLVAAIPNGSGAVIADSTSLVVLHNANVNGGCPATVAQSRTAVPLGLPAGYTVKQVLVTPDSSKAIVSTDKGLVIVNLSTFAKTNVALGGSATGTFTGGVTLDSKLFYVGGDDGTVHRIDLSNNTDAQQIAVGLKKADNSATVPDLVVVRNK